MNIYKRIAKETGITLKEIRQAMGYGDPIDFDFIKTVEDAKENFFILNDLLTASLDRWNKLSLEDLAKADNEDEVWDVWNEAPYESEAKKESFKILLLMNNTVEDLLLLREDSDHGSKEEIMITQKICRLFEKKEGKEDGKEGEEGEKGIN